MPSIAELTERTRLKTTLMLGRFKAAAPPPDSSLLFPGQHSPQSVGGDIATNAAAQYQRFRGWTYAAIRPIAQTIAGQPLRVAKPAGQNPMPRSLSQRIMPASLKSRAEDIELFDSHPVIDLVELPNPLMVKWHLIYNTIVSLELTGRSYWWIIQHDDGRWEIWPLPTHWVHPIHKPRLFSGWKIQAPGASEPIIRPPEEIACFYYPDPSEVLEAYSPSQAQSKASSTDEQMQVAQDRAFQNGIHPGMAIIIGDVTDDDGDGGVASRPALESYQKQQIYAAFEQYYSGAINHDRPIILDKRIRDIKPITRGIREMDFKESGAITKARITQGYGTNPAIMGEIEGLNRASSAAAISHFASFTVNPKIDMISQVLTARVAPLFSRSGEKLFVWLEPFHPEDREQKRKDVEILAKYGAIRRNESRALLLGLPPIEGDDSIVLGTNQSIVPADPVNAEPRSKDASAEPQDYWTENEKRDGDGLPPIPGGDAIFKPSSEIPALEFEEPT